MLKLVPVSSIESDDSFPYDFRRNLYPTSLLRSVLYCPWWTTITDDGCEYATVMDYDGFIEWYNSNEPKWSRDEELTEDERFTAEEYLPYHIGRTLDIVKEV